MCVCVGNTPFHFMPAPLRPQARETSHDILVRLLRPSERAAAVATRLQVTIANSCTLHCRVPPSPPLVVCLQLHCAVLADGGGGWLGVFLTQDAPTAAAAPTPAPPAVRSLSLPRRAGSTGAGLGGGAGGTRRHGATHHGRPCQCGPCIRPFHSNQRGPLCQYLN